MLLDVVTELDDWVVAQNAEARAEGLRLLSPCTIKLLGQAALIESGCKLPLAATRDVDVLADYEWSVQQQFERLLQARGLELDPLGREVWMPRETRYDPLFSGQFVTLLVADSEAVLVSKALKAPAKNGVLITDYLSQGATPRFLQLAHKYAVDLDQFV
jgi:hypothetical protein